MLMHLNEITAHTTLQYKFIVRKYYLKTPFPHPDIEVNNRGAKSLAGFNGAPQLWLKARITAAIPSPIIIG